MANFKNIYRSAKFQPISTNEGLLEGYDWILGERSTGRIFLKFNINWRKNVSMEPN